MIKVDWKATTVYVDVETGEIIEKEKVTKKIYTVLKTTKKLNYERKRIEWTNECERNRQQSLF